MYAEIDYKKELVHIFNDDKILLVNINFKELKDIYNYTIKLPQVFIFSS